MIPKTGSLQLPLPVNKNAYRLRLLLLRRPDAELAAAVEHAKQIQHAVEVTVSTRWNGCIPECLDKLFSPLMSCRETGCGIHGHQSGRSPAADEGAIEFEMALVIGHSRGLKKVLEAIPELLFSDVLCPPCPVHRPVHSRSPRVDLKISGARVPGACPGRGAEIGVIRGQGRGRMCHALKEIATRSGSLCPEGPILFGTP